MSKPLLYQNSVEIILGFYSELCFDNVYERFDVSEPPITRAPS